MYLAGRRMTPCAGYKFTKHACLSVKLTLHIHFGLDRASVLNPLPPSFLCNIGNWLFKVKQFFLKDWRVESRCGPPILHIVDWTEQLLETIDCFHLICCTGRNISAEKKGKQKNKKTSAARSWDRATSTYINPKVWGSIPHENSAQNFFIVLRS